MGGIGIFSVMQISISERTYEIGLRKAMGATDPEIFGQFLIESVSVSLVGGLLGAALGYGITSARTYKEWPVVSSPRIGRALVPSSITSTVSPAWTVSTAMS